MRAIKYRCWNSSLGIDGLIRKASMMACVCFAVVIDGMGDFDLIGLFPTDVISFLSTLHITHAGFAEFFAILFICYECVSILKNMYLCNLPVKWIWKLVYKMLSKYTDELPDADEISNKTA
jgi:toxin secretion/phage lysis holin